jgi:branched-chain amino acid transport system ATP-binding protein
MAALLEVQDVAIRFGGVIALAGVSFTVAQGEIRGVIGPNGSGKTSLFNCLSGIYRPNRGQIVLDGVSLIGKKRHLMAGLGIGRTFQNLALFRTLTVRQNILAGAHSLGQSGFIANMLHTGVARAEAAAAAGQADALIDLLDLGAFAQTRAADVPFPVAKRVELARALIGAPKLLLLDEPACGLNHAEVTAFEQLLHRIRAHFSLGILLVEHHMSLVMSVCDRIAVLEFGTKIADGAPGEVGRNPEVMRAYLGETEHARAA